MNNTRASAAHVRENVGTSNSTCLPPLKIEPTVVVRKKFRMKRKILWKRNPACEQGSDPNSFYTNPEANFSEKIISGEDPKANHVK
jgi:hypothetical protein